MTKHNKHNISFQLNILFRTEHLESLMYHPMILDDEQATFLAQFKSSLTSLDLSYSCLWAEDQ